MWVLGVKGLGFRLRAGLGLRGWGSGFGLGSFGFRDRVSGLEFTWRPRGLSQ